MICAVFDGTQRRRLSSAAGKMQGIMTCTVTVRELFCLQHVSVAEYEGRKRERGLMRIMAASSHSYYRYSSHSVLTTYLTPTTATNKTVCWTWDVKCRRSFITLSKPPSEFERYRQPMVVAMQRLSGEDVGENPNPTIDPRAVVNDDVDVQFSV
jgi:hypothetical protein